MTAAAFVLAINLFVAALFAAAFGVVAAYRRSSLGARWLTAAYGMGVVDVALEFILPYQQDPRPVSVAIFLSFLLALGFSVIGLAHHYRLRPPYRVLAALLVVALAVNLMALDMPRTSLVRNMLYQSPYALVQAIGLAVLLTSRNRTTLDHALLGLLAASALHFLLKPILAVTLGSGATPQAYIGTAYAAYSQFLGAILLISNGLLMLLIILRDVMADMTARSETDTLSGLLNRRGFEDHGHRALAAAARTGLPVVIVVADLDHFKSVNDSHGHAAGDRIIALFASILKETADGEAVVGRLGGEEFSALITGGNIATGRLYAEAVRTAFFQLPADVTGMDTPVTASLGVAQLLPGDTLSDLLRRADMALYQAKSEGRDRVCIAFGEVSGAASPGARRLA